MAPSGEAFRAPSGPRTQDVLAAAGGRGAAQAPPEASSSLTQAADILSSFVAGAGETKKKASARAQARSYGSVVVERDSLQGRQWAMAGSEATKKRWSWEEVEENAETTAEATENGRGKKLMGSSLLPGKWDEVCTHDLSLASMWKIATYPFNKPQLGPQSPEDPRFRMLMTQTTPSILLFELNAQATFNMMDPDLSGDVLFSMEVAGQLMKMPKSAKQTPLAYVVQGSGPHFCPGGNPSPNMLPGHTAFTTTQYTNYLCFVRCRELSIPGVSALTGSLVGGGVAYSLNTTLRLAANNATFAFGNASRGAVPGMALSSNIPQCMGLAGAIDIYLTDSTLNAYAALKGGYLGGVEVGPAGVKTRAVQMARRLAASPLSSQVVGIRPALDLSRYSTESHAINMSAKSGVLFASVKPGVKVAQASTAAPAKEAKPPEEPQAAKTVPPAAAAAAEDWKAHQLAVARPKRRPKRRVRPPSSRGRV